MHSTQLPSRGFFESIAASVPRSWMSARIEKAAPGAAWETRSSTGETLPPAYFATNLPSSPT